MTGAQLGRLLVIPLVVCVALFAGYEIVRGGPIRAWELALLPTLIAGGLVVLKRPEYLGFMMIAILYSNTDAVASWKFEAHTAIIFLMGTFAYYGLLFITRGPRPRVNLPFQMYFAFFIVAATIAALLPENNTPFYYEWLRGVIYALNSFVLTYLMLSSPARLRQIASLITLVGVLVAVLNIFEFMDRSLVDISCVPGRSASLLVNANASAAAILAAFMMSYITRLRFLLLARIVMFVGIWTTFSRAELIMFLVFVLYAEFLIDRFTWKRMAVTLALFGGVASILVYANFLLEVSSNRQVSQAYNRVLSVAQGRFDDSSSVQRLRVIGINFRRFLDHPIFGNKLGTALGDDSPHNQFLFVLAEHGLIGFFLYMGFMYVLLRRLLRLAPGPERRILLCLFAFQFANMFVSHNQYHFRFFVMIFAMLSASAEVLPRLSSAAPRMRAREALIRERQPRALPVQEAV